MFFRRPFFYEKINEKILKFRGKFDKLRSRRVPSHAFVVNLVRPGTEQPQRSECSAEDKARLFFGRFSCVFRAVGSPIMPNSFDLFPLKCLPNINDRSGRNRSYFTVSNSI